MNNRSKAIMCVVSGLLCIGAAAGLIHSFSGEWDSINKNRKVSIAGPLLTYVPELNKSTKVEETTKLYAYISGAVVNPGVYEIKEGMRLFNLVDMAGGLKSDADTSKINLAAPVNDKDHIHVEAITPKNLSSDDPTVSDNK